MHPETLAAPRYQAEAQVDHNKQRYNDLTTLFAEAVESHMRTPFEYTFDGQDFIAEDGQPLTPIFDRAIIDAEEIAEEFPELKFEVRRRLHERCELDDMIGMARGERPNTMVVVRDFPAELRNAKKDVGGYNVIRQQAMLCVLFWQNNKMKMLTQSLDGSNREALEKIYEFFGRQVQPGEMLGQRIPIDLNEEQQNILVDSLTSVYDSNLSELYGGEWLAGRPAEYGDHQVNSYDFVRSQHDIIQNALALDRFGQLDEDTIYDKIALLNERLSKYRKHGEASGYFAPDVYGSQFISLQLQMRAAGGRARGSNKIFSACGVSIGGGPGNSAEDQLEEAGYGNKIQPWYGKYKKKGTCVNCKEKTVVGEKSWCRPCISGHCGIKK
jgi:hypothetical protein